MLHICPPRRGPYSPSPISDGLRATPGGLWSSLPSFLIQTAIFSSILGEALYKNDPRASPDCLFNRAACLGPSCVLTSERRLGHRGLRARGEVWLPRSQDAGGERGGAKTLTAAVCGAKTPPHLHVCREARVSSHDNRTISEAETPRILSPKRLCDNKQLEFPDDDFHHPGPEEGRRGTLRCPRPCHTRSNFLCTCAERK